MESKLPGCRNLETISSGQWPSAQPIHTADDLIWEIPAEYKHDVLLCPGQKIKSLFDLDNLDQDDRWTDADDLLFDQSLFTVKPRSQKGMVFHVARSATVFLESVLKKKCGYKLIVDRGEPVTVTFSLREVMLSWGHNLPHNPNFVLQGQQNFGQIDYDILASQSPDVFFVYRKNWWEWITSNIIMDYTGPFHYDNVPDLSAIPPIEITEHHIQRQQAILKCAFNNLCNMRAKFRDLNFYIFEFSDLIKHQDLTKHSAIKYNKKSLFGNHDEMKVLFEQKYADGFDLLSKRCLSHLVKMNCNTPSNFDLFLLKSKNTNG